MNTDKFLDAKGLACPMPIVRAKKAIEELSQGQILEIHATDKGSKQDLTAWAKSSGHQLLKDREENGIFMFWIKRG